MDDLRARIELLSDERRELLRRLAPREYAGLIGSTPTAPRNGIETVLCAIWSDVFGVPVGIYQNYFELGGDSILSVAVVAKARARGLALTAHMLFERPTVAALAEDLERSAVRLEPHPPKEAVADTVPAPFALTAIQRGILFHGLQPGGRSVYVTQLSCRLGGGFDFDRFRRACDELMRRHPMLRMSIDLADPADPMQVTHAVAEWPIERHDLSGLTPPARETTLGRLLRADISRGFDLATAPLTRLSLIEMDAQTRWCIWTHHHLILDGWSQQVLVHQLFKLYDGEALPPIRASFADYAAWLGAADVAQHDGFWQGYLAGAPRTAARASDAPPADLSSISSVVLGVSEQDTDALQAVARASKATLAMQLASAWALALGEVLGTDDVSFGMTASLRPAELPDSEEIVGPCINTLPARIRIAQAGALGRWLEDVRGAHLQWMRHIQTPLSAALRAGGVAHAFELFSSLLVVENLPLPFQRPPHATPAVECIRCEVCEGYPLIVVATPGPMLRLEFKYDTRSFARDEVNTLARLVETVLFAIASNDGSSMADIRHRLRMLRGDDLRRRVETRGRADIHRLQPREAKIAESGDRR
jgi:aryl carrier-like protein